MALLRKRPQKFSGRELEDKINTFHHLAANLKQGGEDIAYLLKEESDTLCLQADEIIKVFEEKEIPRIRQCLQDVFVENADTNPTVLRDKLQKVIKQEVIKGFDEFRKDTQRVISDNIQETINRSLKRFIDFIYEFKTAVEILFEIPMGQFEYFVEPTRENSFYRMAQEDMVSPDGEFKFVLRSSLPNSISMKLILYEIIDRMASDVNRNCNRIRYELRAWIHTTVDHYSQQLEGVGNILIAQIEQAIQKGSESRATRGKAIQLELEILADRAKTLEEYKEGLSVKCH